MSRRDAPLRMRLMWAFALFALFTAALFGLYALNFMYAVEDSFLESTLAQEASAQQRLHAATGQWGPTREAHITLHLRTQDLPADLREAHASEPWRREFTGQQGRHYHVLPLRDARGVAEAWLVAEVSQQLVVRRMRGEVLVLLAGSAAALLLLALAMAAWLARRIARPLDALARAVDQMDPGDLPQRLSDGYRNDEVGVLARGLDQLTQRLRDFVAREREFTRDVSHELRTPLTVIRSASERLLAHEGLDAQSRASVQQLHQSALQLQQSIDLLLALARESSLPGGEPVRVLPLLERVIVDTAALGPPRDLNFDLQVPADTLSPLPEPVLLCLLSNLVGNAMTHGADGTIVVSSADGWLRIANPVRAQDAGEAAGFEHRREDSPGLGLGLGIVRRLCERHGMALRVVRLGERVEVAFSLQATSPCPSPRRP